MDENSAPLHSLGLAILAALTASVAYRLSLPVVAFHARDDLRAPMWALSVMFMAFMLTRALFSVISGRLADRAPRAMMNIALAMIAAKSAIVYLYGLTGSWLEISLIRSFDGAASGMSWPLVQFYVASKSPERIRGRTMAVYFMMSAVGVFSADLVYSVVYRCPMTALLTASSVLFIVASVLMATSVRLSGGLGEVNRSTNSGKSGGKLGRYVILGGLLLAFTASFTRGDLSYVYISETLRVSRGFTALLLAASGVAGIIGSYLLGWMADRVSEVGSLSLTLFMGSLASLSLLIGLSQLVVSAVFLASIADRGYFSISRRYLVTHTVAPGGSVGLINASSNIGVTTGQLLFGYMHDVAPSIRLGTFVLSGAPASLSISIPLLIFTGVRILREGSAHV